MATVAVTGATGSIGRRVIAALLERGDRVVALVRSPPREGLPPEVEQRAWDATFKAARLEGVDAIVHLAGAPVANRRWTDARKRYIELSRILGTRSIVAGMREFPGVRVLVSASGIDYHGDTGDAPVTEESPAGKGFLADLAVRWEQEAEKARALGARVVLLRTGLVLAPGEGALARMEPIFRAGLGARLGSGAQWVPWIHWKDEVGLVLHALDRAEVDGPMIAAAPNPVSNREFTRALAQAVGRRPFPLPAPAPALRLLLGEMATVVLSSHRVSPEVALRSGYAFRFPELGPALADLYAP
jgi:uncharacterized protein (TIGR01777 family)